MSATPLNFPCMNCGAHLVVDGSTQTPICSYCHTQTLLPEEVWERFHPKAAVARYVPPIGAPEKKSIAAWVAGPLVVIAIGVVIGLAVSQGSTKPALIANAGEPCDGRTNACSTDKKAYLVCGDNDKLAVTETCKGPNGCRVVSGGTDITCDATFADAKDPCDGTDDACSTDHKAELACVAGKYVVRATCKGPDGCTLSPAKTGAGSTMACDDHIADVGDPCFDGERTACSTDHKNLLTCTAQKYVVDRACKGAKGCTMTKDIGGKTMTVDCESPSR